MADHEIYKMLQFRAKLNTNYPVILKGELFEKLTDVNFAYVMYLIIILRCLKKLLIWMKKYKVA